MDDPQSVLIRWSAEYYASQRITATGSANTLPVDKEEAEAAEKRRRPLGFASTKDES